MTLFHDIYHYIHHKFQSVTITVSQQQRQGNGKLQMPTCTTTVHIIKILQEP